MPPQDALLDAFGEVAREALAERETVPLPGLGRLRVRHEPSRSHEKADGTRRLLPPRDHVVLETEHPSDAESLR